MKKYVLMLAAAGLVAAPAMAKANEHDAAAPAAVVEHADHAADTEHVEHELADGTKVVVKGDEVFVVGADGKETPAPDGTHTFKDGTTATTKGGKLVK